MNKQTSPFTWEIDLGKLIGQRFDLETHEGLRRDAAIFAKVEWNDGRDAPLQIDGTAVQYPVAFLFGKNADDRIPFTQIRWMRRSKA